MNLQATRISRRNALIGGGGALVAIGAFAASPLSNPLTSTARSLLASQPWARRFLSLAHGSYEEWLELVGSTFSVGAGGGMRLAGVRAFPSAGDRPYSVTRRTGFVAFFDAAGGQTMAGDLIYTVTHPQYGPFQVFLSASPDSRTPGRMHAVFN